MNKYDIIAVPVNMIDLLWYQIEPLLQLAVDISDGEMTCEHVYDRAKEGNTLLICICEGPIIISVITVEIRDFPNGKKALCLPMVGGKDVDNWVDDFMEVIKQIAKDFKCEEIRGYAARLGWMRKLKDKGWSELYSTICYKIGQ